MSVEREREHTIDGPTTSEDLLANLSEEQENIVQLQQIKDATVEPGLMRLPVSVVTKATNSENWAIEVDHPLEGTLRFYRNAPTDGWYPESGNIVEMLAWYDINGDPYQLQLMRIYMKKTGDQAEQPHGWEPAQPPGYEPPIREQLQEKATWIKQNVKLDRTVSRMWMTLFLGAVLASAIPPIPLIDGLLGRVVSSILVFLGATVFGLVLLDPPEAT